MKKIVYYLVVTTVVSLIAFLLHEKYETDIEKLKTYRMQMLTQRFEGVLTAYRLNAINTFENIIMQPDVLGVIRQLPETSEDKREELRSRLYDILQDRYFSMKKNLNIRQLHFHYPDGRSFLRMHRPEKYDDPLFDVRYSIYFANTKKRYVEGFEEGRIFNGYRYVYPIMDNGKHLGSVEISISINAVIEGLKNIFTDNSFYFMIKKSVVEANVFDEEQGNYFSSAISDKYFVDQEVLMLFDKSYTPCLRRLAESRELPTLLETGFGSVMPIDNKGQDVIATLLPIKNIKQEQVAYLIDFETNNQFASRKNEWYYQLFLLLIGAVAIVTFSHYLHARARRAEEEKERLDELVALKTAELQEVQEEKIQTYKDIIFALVNLTEERDTYTAGHTKRVAHYSILLGKQMRLDEEKIKHLEEAAILHDIGKIVTPDSVLLKPGKLTKREYDIIKEHVIVGESILKNINFHKDIIETIKYHHERSDGSGYPYGITNDDIPLLAKILAVADTFDAMTTNRIYKPRKDISVALAELESLKGTLYDCEVIEAAQVAFKDIAIDLNVTQLPTNIIEQERLSHYFKDPLTDLFNMRYLHLIMEYGLNGEVYTCANIVSIKNFTSFNQTQGWEAGDKILAEVADYLGRVYDSSLVFRIYGDDFVVLHREHIEVNIDALAHFILEYCNFDLQFALEHYELMDQRSRLELIENLERTIG